MLSFHVRYLNGKEEELLLPLERVIVVGYSGSNIKKIQEHIQELKENLGVAEPKRIPTIFECSREVITFENNLRFIGNMSSGEVEYVIIRHQGKIYIGLGSDHTDRKLESVSVLKSKQICSKPISDSLWSYEEVKEHWKEIKMRSYQVINGEEVLYQDGSLADILPVEKIIEELESRVGKIDDCIILSGTVPLVGKFQYGSHFRGEMIDEVLGRKLSIEYSIEEITEEER